MTSIRHLLPALYFKLKGGRCLKYVGTEGPKLMELRGGNSDLKKKGLRLRVGPLLKKQ
jgi:hypothetical protein